MEDAKLILDNQEYHLPVVQGTDGSRSIHADSLFEKTGLRIFDPRLNNVNITKSAITYIDPVSGRLLYRGYRIEDLVEHSSFVEVSFLLNEGELPNQEQYANYSNELCKHSMIHESMRYFFDAFPGDAHPIAILATMVTALSAYYPSTYEENLKKGVDIRARLLAKVRTLAAWSYKKSVGEPVVYPRDEMPYCTNFLNMLFAVPAETYQVPKSHDRVLNQLLILYSDHEQNTATTTMRLVASSQANLFACINAAMCAMWGSREFGANIPPIPMLDQMTKRRQSPEEYFEKFIKGQEIIRSNGLGHSSYRTQDPRAIIARKLFHEFRKTNEIAAVDPLFEKALEVEEFTLGHPYFKEKGLYPNLDYYSALIFRMIGLPMTMNNVIRTIGKLSGWLAHWMEQHDEGVRGAYRPGQVYTGVAERPFPTDRQGTHWGPET
ncbi:MAG TPA: citrate/2-methylcitrate synthase [Leptospiraceae bacterium]|nr:citrate/2-methylcitrate synthase [Leptospiraceae bacterium]HMW59663.1 citrate/2-methylcitrate synthase [Leptospiraceae bacterium]